MKTSEQRMPLTSVQLRNLMLSLLACLSLCLLSPAQVTAQAVCTPTIKTDRGLYPKPTPPPTLPAAGGTFCDPTFGTRIMRVTDIGNAPGGAGTSYSYWPTFNSNNSKILVMDPSLTPRGFILEFNPTTFSLGARHDFVALQNSNPAKLDDAVWSHNNPNILFVHVDNGTKVYSYDVSNPGYTPIVDLDDYLAPDHFVTQMSVSRDDRTFAFNITRVECNPLTQKCIYPDSGYIVFRRSINLTDPPVKIFQSAEGINEVRIDKSGRYLFVNKNLPDPNGIEVQIIDLETGLLTNLTDGYPNYAPSHYDVGTGIAVGAADALPGITARSMASPFGFTKILGLKDENNGGGYHLSMLADNEDWVLVGYYTSHVNGVMQDELVQVATRLAADGTERIRRLVHHQSIWQGDSPDENISKHGYDDSPRANISRDGRFIAFRSNWGRTGATTTRHDLFIAEIPPAPSLTPTSDVVWVEDAVPTGGVTGGDFESWNWINSNPTPSSGTLAHQSNVFAGLHQHFFNGATSTLAVGAGETLYTYVYLDPANPPSELMLQWNDGTWEHRAYWGANIITWGTDNTSTRRYMGPLPATGQWVRLEVPASMVGLEGQTLNGMAFTLHGGRATWDRAGKSGAGAPTPTPTPGADVVWIEDAIPAGGLVGADSEPWSWVGSNPSPFSGATSHQSTINAGVHQHYFYDATSTLTVNSGDQLVTYVYLDPNNLPHEIMLQWNNGTWEHRAYWGADHIPWGTNGTNSRRHMGALPAAGQWVRLEVPASAVGLEGSTLNGMAFVLNGGRATWDRGGKSTAAATPTPTPPPATDVVWIEDAVPAGGVSGGEAEGWNWVSSNPSPLSGTAAHQSNIAGGMHQHFFHSATSGLTINTGDKLITYVYLNPDNPPTELMLQWHAGGWEHRAYWGANTITWGTNNTNSRRYMGPLPALGQWIRLEVPASQVGLEGQTINGMAFTLYGGGATWDRAGKSP